MLPRLLCILAVIHASGCRHVKNLAEPITKAHAYGIAGLTPEKMGDSRRAECVRLSEDADWSRALERPDYFMKDGAARIKEAPTPWPWSVLVGYFPSETPMVAEAAGTQERLCMAGRMVWPLFGPWFQMKTVTHSVDTGEETGRGAAYGIGLLTLVAGWSYTITPVQLPAAAKYPYSGSDRYLAVKSALLLWGLVGWQRVNDRYYVRFLWIPIPAGGAYECAQDGP